MRFSDRILPLSAPQILSASAHIHRRKELPAHRRGLSLFLYGMWSPEHPLLLRRFLPHMQAPDPVLFRMRPAEPLQDTELLFLTSYSLLTVCPGPFGAIIVTSTFAGGTICPKWILNPCANINMLPSSRFGSISFL